MDTMQWQSLLQLDNDSYNDNQWQQAEFFYSEAYDLLAYGYRNNPVCEETMIAWVCTCHNLSALYEQMGNTSLSLRFLTVPHEYLQDVSQTDNAPNDIKLLAIKGLSLTLPALLTFAKKHPICEDCLKTLEGQALIMAEDIGQLH